MSGELRSIPKWDDPPELDSCRLVFWAFVQMIAHTKLSQMIFWDIKLGFPQTLKRHGKKRATSPGYFSKVMASDWQSGQRTNMAG